LSRDASGNLATSGTDLRFNTTGTARHSPTPSSAWSSPAAQWPLMAILVVFVALAASALVYRKRKTASNNAQPAVAKEDERPPAVAGGLHPIGDASLPPPEGGGLLSDEIEVLEMEPARPLTQVKCPACGTHVDIYEPGPQRIQCPGCGTKGMYRPKG